MPLTLDKLFSLTDTVEVEVLGETVTVVWAPARYTGEMDELAGALVDEEEVLEAEATELDQEAANLATAGDDEGAKEKIAAAAHVRARKDRRDRQHLRKLLATLLVSWDVMDGKKPIGTDLATLKKLPDSFLTTVFLALGQANQVDPTKAPASPATSEPKASSAQSRNGTHSSGPLTTLASRPGSSTDEPIPSDITLSGAAGRS